jgi:hypothetical protein
VAWLTIIFGLSYVIGVAGFWIGGYDQPLLWAGTAVGFIVGTVWAFRLGWLLLQGRLVQTALTAAGNG